MSGSTAPVAPFQGQGEWARDVPKGCACPWRYDKPTKTWVRKETATCRVHTTGQLLTEEVKG